MPELDEIRQAVRRPWADFAETVIGWHRFPAGSRPLVVGPANTAEYGGLPVELLRFRYRPACQHIAASDGVPITDVYRYCALAQPLSELAPPLSNTSRLIHRLNRLGVVDAREGLTAGRPVALLPRWGTKAGGALPERDK